MVLRLPTGRLAASPELSKIRRHDSWLVTGDRICFQLRVFTFGDFRDALEALARILGSMGFILSECLVPLTSFGLWFFSFFTMTLHFETVLEIWDFAGSVGTGGLQ